MNIFISWSGKKSKKAAKALQDWLREVIQVVNPWMSEDIPGGRDSLKEISDALKQARYGILCITADNLSNPWIIYEASALYNSGIDVCPYVIELDILKRTLPAPLRNLQAKMADLEGTLQLVLNINKALGSPVADVDTLKKAVRSKWKRLEKQFERIRHNDSPPPKDYEKIFEDFIEIFMDVNKHRASLNFSSLVDDAIELFVANKYKRNIIVERALKTIEESRDLFNRRSILIGNVRDFLKEHFMEDDLANIISRLEPILFSKSSRNVKRDKLLRRIKIEELEVFLRFHQILVDKLREKLS